MIKEVKYLRQTTMNVYFEIYGEDLTENEIENVREIRSNSTFGNDIRITNGKTVAQVTCYKD